MRTIDEIQRAHDMLAGIMLDEVPEAMRLNDENKQKMAGMACVLCWVLRHDHNKTFGNLLSMIEEACTELGVVIEPRDQ